MIYKHLVLQHGKLDWKGTPRLWWRPDDGDDSFLASADVPEESAASLRQALLGRKFHSVDGTDCIAEPSEFLALAWSMPVPNPAAENLSSLPDAKLAAELFRIGTVLYVARTKEGCALDGPWAVDSDVRTLVETAQATSDPAKVDRQAAELLSRTDRKSQKRWTQFRSEQISANPKLEASLPTSIAALPGHDASWVFSSGSLRDLRFLSVTRTVTPELLGYLNTPENPWFVLSDGMLSSEVGATSRPLGPTERVFDGDSEPMFVRGLMIGDRRYVSVQLRDRRVTLAVSKDKATVIQSLSFGPSTPTL